MPLPIDNLEVLQQYFEGVVERSEHHAPNVSEIIYSLLGMVVLTHDKNAKLEVKEYDGRPANILWFYKDSKRYALAFNHNTGNIEIRDRSTHGTVVGEVNNATTFIELRNIFEQM